MSLLTVDIGNTDIKFALFRNGAMTRHWRAEGSHAIAPVQFEALLQANVPDDGLAAVAYVSVVPNAESALQTAIRSCCNLPEERIFTIQPEHIRLPLDMGGYPLSQLGKDRLVNVCGARLLYPDTALVVVDFGTATTFNLVTADGVYRGGAITPGLTTFCNILADKTAQLPRVSLIGKTAEDIRIGMDTQGCLEAGLGFGYRGLLKDLLDASLAELATDAYQVIATGGLAESAIRLCGLESSFHTIDPTLTLRGLQLLYDYNRPEPMLRTSSNISDTGNYSD